MADWRMEEQQLKLALDALANAGTEDRALSAEGTLELANKAYSLYVSQDSFEKAKLLRMLLLKLLDGCSKRKACLPIPLRPHLQKGQNGRNGRDD